MAMHDHVQESVRLQSVRILKVRWKLDMAGFLDDARTGKADSGPRFGQDDVGQVRKTRGYALVNAEELGVTSANVDNMKAP